MATYNQRTEVPKAGAATVTADPAPSAILRTVHIIIRKVQRGPREVKGRRACPEAPST